MTHLSIVKKLLFISLLFSFFASVNTCLAGGIKVTPAVISQKALPRDFLEFKINIENQTSRPTRLYATVNDISMKEGKKEFLDPTKLSRPTSLARWVRISRGMVRLSPGENRDIPLSIEVPPDAEPGKYYVVISFPSGSNREEAEEKAESFNQPQILLDIEVELNTVEKAQIKKFTSQKSLFFEFPVKFSLEIENIGDQNIKPEGSIYIYNRKGEEIKAVPVNERLAAVSPLSSKVFEDMWDEEKGFGRYKARLVMEYGGEGKQLQDTIYFWILPWKFLAIILGGFLILIMILTSIILGRRPSPEKKSSGRKSSISAIDISSFGK